MAKEGQNGDPDFVETRRCILQASSRVNINRVESYFPPGTLDLELRSAVLSRQAFQVIIKKLRSAGFTVSTIEDEIASLPSYTPLPLPSTPFHLYKIPELNSSPDKLEWRIFSFFDRKFKPCPKFRQHRSERLFLREQAVLGAFDERFMLRGIWVASTEEIGLQNASRNETLIRAHMQSRLATFYYKPEGAFALIYVNYVWLPGLHYHLLFEKLAIQKPEKGANCWLIRIEDVEAMRRIVGSLGLVLKEGEPPQVAKAKALETAESAAGLIKLCYTHYLRSRYEKFGEFAEIAANRDWGSISDNLLRSKLISLSNAAYGWKKPASDLMEYICDLLPTDISWGERRERGLPTDIEGVAIDVDASGYHASMPFFKVVLPEFDLMLGLLTSRLIEDTDQIRLPIYWIADKWRIVPYAGRLILSSGRYTEVLIQKSARREAIKQAFDRIHGIPTLEDVLVKELYLSAFFLDHDERLWKGCPEFSRYFTGYGRLLEKETGEFEQPTALMEDVFGNQFYLAYGEANYVRRVENIGWMRVEGPKRFFARSGLIQQLRMELPIPYFTLLEGTSPRDVGWDEVLSGTYMALLRYYRTRTEEQLLSGVDNIRQPYERKTRILTEILLKGRALKHKGGIHYVYEFMKPENLRAIIEKRAAPNDIQFSFDSLLKFQSIVHPFASGRSILSESTPWEGYARRYLPAASRNPIVISSDDIHHWVAEIVKAIRQWGIAVVSVHPWRERIAANVIAGVRTTLREHSIEIGREDVSRQYRRRNINETHYRLSVNSYLMLRGLQKNPAFKVSK